MLVRHYNSVIGRVGERISQIDIGKATLIGLAVVYMITMLFVPALSVFYEAFSKGIDRSWQQLLLENFFMQFS